jgi:hypothetical protein
MASLGPIGRVKVQMGEWCVPSSEELQKAGGYANRGNRTVPYCPTGLEIFEWKVALP